MLIFPSTNPSPPVWNYIGLLNCILKAPVKHLESCDLTKVFSFGTGGQSDDMLQCLTELHNSQYSLRYIITPKLNKLDSELAKYVERPGVKREPFFNDGQFLTADFSHTSQQYLRLRDCSVWGRPSVVPGPKDSHRVITDRHLNFKFRALYRTLYGKDVRPIHSVLHASGDYFWARNRNQNIKLKSWNEDTNEGIHCRAILRITAFNCSCHYYSSRNTYRCYKLHL